MEDKRQEELKAAFSNLRAFMEEQKNWTPEQKEQFRKRSRAVERMLYHPWTKDDTEQK